MRVNVAFPVGDRHDLPRIAEQTTGGSGCLDPAGALLVLDRPRPLVGGRDRIPRPDARMHDAQHRLLFDVDDQQGMDEEAQCLAVAGWPEPTATAIGAGEVDLGGVLHGQHPPAGRRLDGALGRRGDDGLVRYAGVVQEAMRGDLASARSTDLAHDERAGLNDPLQNPLTAPLQAHVLCPDAHPDHPRISHDSTLNHAARRRGIVHANQLCERRSPGGGRKDAP
jgi:hypothetical protein